MNTITIAFVRHTLTVEAHVCGTFAVHAPNGAPLRVIGVDGWYTVSHVGTGYACTAIRGRAAALALAQQLDGLLTEDFTLADFSGEQTERYRAFKAAAKPLINAARERAEGDEVPI